MQEATGQGVSPEMEQRIAICEANLRRLGFVRQRPNVWHKREQGVEITIALPPRSLVDRLRAIAVGRLRSFVS